MIEKSAQMSKLVADGLHEIVECRLYLNMGGTAEIVR